MTHDLSDFERQLGEELTAAARRRIEARDSSPPTRRWRPISMAAAAALVVLTAAVFLFTALRPQPVAAQVVFDGAGRAERIIMPRTVDGRLTVRYGREAQPGEHYDANITSPVCRELWARTPQQAAARVAESPDSIRYDTIDSDYRYASDVTLAEIDPDYRLIDIVFLADDKILVTYAAHLDALGSERPDCGWPAAHSR